MQCRSDSCRQGRKPCTTPSTCGVPDDLDAAAQAARELRLHTPWTLHRESMPLEQTGMSVEFAGPEPKQPIDWLWWAVAAVLCAAVLVPLWNLSRTL